MNAVFLKILNMSISASYLAVAVVLLRLFFKRAPRWITCALWGLVALRLLVPFSLESYFSLVPKTEPITERTVSVAVPTRTDEVTISSADDAVVRTAPAAPQTEDATKEMPPEAQRPVDVVRVLAWVWLGGVALMLVYALASYAKIRLRVGASIKMQDKSYLCGSIPSPFILGIVRPKIYVPDTIDKDDLVYVLSHEEAHLRRFDHLWKPLGFVILSVYWFNPLFWVAYVLLCRDIEYACDEKVIGKQGEAFKKPYSEALLRCSVTRRAISACPVAFGEAGVKGRIKRILNYRKPALGIIIVLLIASLAAVVCFMTDPKSKPEEDHRHIMIELSVPALVDAKKKSIYYDITDEYRLYYYKNGESIEIELDDAKSAELKSIVNSLDNKCYSRIAGILEIPIITIKYDNGYEGLYYLGEPDNPAFTQIVQFCGLNSPFEVKYYDGSDFVPFDFTDHEKCSPQQKLYNLKLYDLGESEPYMTFGGDGELAAVCPDGHSFKTTAVSSPTCSSLGEELLVCSVCGVEQSRKIPRLPHEYTSTVSGEANCSAGEVTTYTCSVCGHSYSEEGEISPDLHDYSVVETVTSPGCTVAGTNKISCSRCGAYYTEKTAAAGHSFAVSASTPATCLADGYEIYTCNGCGDSYKSILSATGHNYADATWYTPETCTLCGETRGNALKDTPNVSCTVRMEALGEDGLNYTSYHEMFNMTSHRFLAAIVPSDKPCYSCREAGQDPPMHTHGTQCIDCGLFLRAPDPYENIPTISLNN